jgi:hypothetical protein
VESSVTFLKWAFVNLEDIWRDGRYYRWALDADHPEPLYILALGMVLFEAMDSKHILHIGILLHCVDREHGLYKRLGLL